MMTRAVRHPSLLRAWLSVVPLAAACSFTELPLPPAPGVAEAVSFEAFSPSHGFAGDPIRVTGRGFGTDPAAVEVLFNGYGARAESIDETGTALVVRVPGGVASGPLTLRAPGGVAVSSTPFTFDGAGHLARGTVRRLRQLRAELGGLAEDSSGRLYVLARATHQLVDVEGGSRRRLSVSDTPLFLASEVDHLGRFVVVCGGTLHAGAELSDQREAPTAILPFGGELPVGVVLSTDRRRAIVATATRLVDVDLTKEVVQRPTARAVEEGRVVGIGRTQSGGLALALTKESGGLLALVDATTGAITSFTLPALPAAAPVALDSDSGAWIVVPVLPHALAFVRPVDGVVRVVDLYADGPATHVVAAGGLAVASVPSEGRLVAIHPDERLPRWRLDTGGEPGALHVDGEVLHVANAAVNEVELVSLTRQALLGEHLVRLEAGSSMGPRNGAVALTATFSRFDTSITADVVVVLSRAGETLVGVGVDSPLSEPVALLAPAPVGFAASPDLSRAVVAHADGRLGLVSPGLPAAREVIVCSGGPLCPLMEGPPVALEMLDVDRVLVVTASRAEVRRLPLGTLESFRVAGDGGQWVGASTLGGTIALAWADDPSDPSQLRFERFTGPSLTTPSSTFEEKALDAVQRRYLLGVSSFRVVEGPPSPVFFFARVNGRTNRPWLFAPDRATAPLMPAPVVGKAPLFSPDGRQAIGAFNDQDLGTQGLLFVADGELLSPTGLSSERVLDLGGSPSALAYDPRGDVAYAVIGETDQLGYLE